MKARITAGIEAAVKLLKNQEDFRTKCDEHEQKTNVKFLEEAIAELGGGEVDENLVAKVVGGDVENLYPEIPASDKVRMQDHIILCDGKLV